MSSNESKPQTRIVFGEGSLSRVGDLCRELGASRVLLVSDPGVEAAGHTARALALLRDAGLVATLFDAVIENPTEREARLCAQAMRECDAQLIVALGGGSAIDTAKGGAFLLHNGGSMRDYRGYGKATKPMPPLIAIPTTAGTGSDVQSYALIADESTHEKMACGDPKAAPRVALLDPELTLTMPPRVTAHTGIDAIAHAVESYVTRTATDVSRRHASDAMRLLAPNFARVMTTPGVLAARGAMLHGASLAGMAIELSMLGAAHSCANPLTARFNVVHGQAVGVMLPHVVRLNTSDKAVSRRYAELAESAALRDITASREPGEALARLIESFLDAGRLARSLRTLGVREGDVSALAKDASAQWTAGFNPVPVDAGVCERLYRAAM